MATFRRSGTPNHPCRARFVRLTACTLLSLGAVGCHELLVEPAPRVAGLVVSFSGIPSAPEGIAFGGVAEALDQADQVEIRLRRGETMAVSETRGFSSDGEETRLQVEVDVEGDSEVFSLELLLYAEGSELFRAARQVTLQANETTRTEVTLEPVPAGIQVSPTTAVLEALGEELQLSAVVTFATGDSIPGPTPTWTSLDPEVVEITPDGRATAVSEGQAAVAAEWEQFTTTATVEVRQTAASVEVSPSSATLAPGGTVTLGVTLQDANGNRIPPEGRSVAWSSSDEGVATVDQTGEVRGISDGTATITATVDGASGSASVTVVSASGVVVGVVVEGGTGASIPGATVELGGETTTTDSQGFFEVAVPVGVHTARINAPDFVEREIPGVEVLEDRITEVGTVQLFSDAFEDIFGIWAYREVVEVPEAELPDFLVFQPPEFLWDVEDRGSCFLVDEPNVEILRIEGDFWTFQNLDDGEVFTYRIFLEEPDVLRMELQDSNFPLTFIFDRTSLVLEDFQPECATAQPSESGSGGPLGASSGGGPRTP